MANTPWFLFYTTEGPHTDGRASPFLSDRIMAEAELAYFKEGIHKSRRWSCCKVDKEKQLCLYECGYYTWSIQSTFIYSILSYFKYLQFFFILFQLIFGCCCTETSQLGINKVSPSVTKHCLSVKLGIRKQRRVKTCRRSSPVTLVSLSDEAPGWQSDWRQIKTSRRVGNATWVEPAFSGRSYARNASSPLDGMTNDQTRLLFWFIRACWPRLAN